MLLKKNLKLFISESNFPIFFFRPSSKEILIYDNQGSKYIGRYLKKNSYEILHTRKEKFSILIILKCLLKLKFTTVEYVREYIKFVRPKLIISYIDNNPSFYNLKNISSARTLFIQNSNRSSFNDIFFDTFDSKMNLLNEIKEKKFYVDYMLMWNNKIGKLYNKFIKGETISIGSFRNNFLIKKKLPLKNKIILFISNFKNMNKSDKIKGIGEYKNFIKNEKKLLRLIRDYCVINNLQIHVLGKYLNNPNTEKKYFNKFFSCVNNYKFIPATYSRETYSIALKYHIIVAIESSLGHEMLAQKRRVAFFSTHEDTYPMNTLYFDWLGKRKKSGPFWTNKLTKNNIKNVLDFLIRSTDAQWIEKLNKYKSNLMNIDKNNRTFVQIIKNEKLENCLK
jgi:surface carbohydrate biosynthesis protein